jgi:hypothetical protein
MTSRTLRTAWDNEALRARDFGFGEVIKGRAADEGVVDTNIV